MKNENSKWDVVNHGGQPTSNPDKKYAIFIGRYQPLSCIYNIWKRNIMYTSI